MLRLVPRAKLFDKILSIVYSILADMYKIQAVNYLDDFIDFMELS